MKKIRKNELYNNVGAFLRKKGLELKDGAYANTIRNCCGILTDAANLGQQGLERAKTEIDARLAKVRQVIHEKTAPKPPPMKPSGKRSTAAQPSKKSPAKSARPPKAKKPASKPRRGAKKS